MNWILIFAASILLCACGVKEASSTLDVGNTTSPLHGLLYAAEENRDASIKSPRSVSFDGNGELAAALVSNKIQAAFLETEFAVKFLEVHSSTYEAVGVVEFPYGATIVVRKGLDLKIRDLKGRTVARSSGVCKLAKQVAQDANRFALPIDTVNWVHLPFRDMVPALEAGKIDAAVLKGSHALLAQKLGHTILYQNWNMKAGDDCCPAIVAQAEFILVVRKGWSGTPDLQKALANANAKPPSEIRAATSRKIAYDSAILADFPTTSYRALSHQDVDSLLGHYHHAH